MKNVQTKILDVLERNNIELYNESSDCDTDPKTNTEFTNYILNELENSNSSCLQVCMFVPNAFEYIGT